MDGPVRQAEGGAGWAFPIWLRLGAFHQLACSFLSCASEMSRASCMRAPSTLSCKAPKVPHARDSCSNGTGHRHEVDSVMQQKQDDIVYKLLSIRCLSATDNLHPMPIAALSLRKRPRYEVHTFLIAQASHMDVKMYSLRLDICLLRTRS